MQPSTQLQNNREATRPCQVYAHNRDYANTRQWGLKTNKKDKITCKQQNACVAHRLVGCNDFFGLSTSPNIEEFQYFLQLSKHRITIVTENFIVSKMLTQQRMG
jgi:hypothetical protein